MGPRRGDRKEGWKEMRGGWKVMIGGRGRKARRGHGLSGQVGKSGKEC